LGGVSSDALMSVVGAGGGVGVSTFGATAPCGADSGVVSGNASSTGR
jgi:hypothetical protein